MSSIDNRIVNMQFTNKQFNSGAADSEKALQSLEKTLNNTAKNKGLGALGSAAEGVKNRFTALQVAGVTAMANITNRAVDAGIKMVKSLTLDPIMDGFREYETKMGSIQTIMANTGKPLQVVNKYLNELNEYSDRTIYNFGDMVKNISLFTNAGIGIKSATAMIKGFSNEAAVSGTNAMQAAGAAYQLSQALSAGEIRLMDWRSLTNVGMGNAIMKDGLIEIADAMGTFDSATTKSMAQAGKFNETLEKGWLTADVMTKYLSIQAGELSREQMKTIGLSDKQIDRFMKQQKVAQDAATKVRTFTALMGSLRESVGSLVAQSFEIIIGDFNHATRLFSKMYEAGDKMIAGLGGAVSESLADWREAGGRRKIIRGIERSVGALADVLRVAGAAFREAFPGGGDNLLIKFSDGFKIFTKAIVPSTATLENLESIFGGIFSALHIATTVLGGVATVAKELFSTIFSSSELARTGVLDLLAQVGEAVSAFDKWLTSGERFSEVMEQVGQVAGTFIKPYLTGIGLVIQAFGLLASGAGIDAFMGKLDEARRKFAEYYAAIFDGLAYITQPFTALSDLLSNISDKLKDFSGNAEGVKNVGESVKGLADIGSIGGGDAGAKVSAGFDKVKTSADSTKGAILGMFGALTGPEANTGAKASEAVGEGASMASERWQQAWDIIKSVGGFIKKQLGDLFGDLDALEIAGLINAAFAGGFLLAMKRFMDFMQDFVARTGSIRGSISFMFSELGKSFTGLTEAMGTQAKAELIKSYAIAIGVLAASLAVLSFIPVKKLATGLGALSTLITLMVVSLSQLAKVDAKFDVVKMAGAMVLISGAMINLALATTILGAQDLDSLAKGLGAMAIALAVMTKSILAMSKIEGSLVSAGAAILIMSVAMSALAGAVLAFGSMSMETLSKGLGAMAIGINLMVVALNRLSSVGWKKLLAGSTALLLVSVAMNAMALAVLAFGNMDLRTLAVGFGAMAVGLGIMVGALMLLGGASKNVAIAAASMVLMATALNMLVGVILILGATPWQVIAQGLIAFGAALAILLAAGAIAGIPVVTAGLYALGITVGLLGAAMFLAGAGMLAFGTGFALMAAAGVAGVAVLVAGFQAFMMLLPTFAQQVAASMVALLATLAAASPKIRKSMAVIFANMLGTIRDVMPEIEKTMISLVDTAINVLEHSIPRWIEMGMTIIDKFIESAAEHVPNIAASASKLIVEFIKELENHYRELIRAGTDLIITVIKGLGEAAVEITTATAETVLTVLRGLDAAIDKYSKEFRDVGLDIAQSIISGMTGGLSDKLAGAVSSAVDNLPGPLRDILGRGMARAATPLQLAQRASGSAIGVAIKNQGNGDKAATKAAKNFYAAQRNADSAAARADIADQSATAADRAATAAERKAKGKKANSPAAKRARKLRRKADAEARRSEKAQAAADRAQEAADKKNEEMQWRQNYANASAEGRGDMQTERANEYAQESQRLAAKSEAEYKAASKLSGKARKQMEARAKADAIEAARLGRLAIQYDRDADKNYGLAVQERINALNNQRAADEKAKKEQAEYDAADDQGKAEIMAKRAAASEAEAKQKNDAALKAIEMAAKYKDTDSKRANEFLDLAEQYYDESAAAEERAKQEREQAEQLRNGGTSGGSKIITPSRSVLEDAASVLDRYSASLQQAEDLAQAAPVVNQYTQNNYSPEALDDITIYRQTKNLLSTTPG